MSILLGFLSLFALSIIYWIFLIKKQYVAIGEYTFSYEYDKLMKIYGNLSIKIKNVTESPCYIIKLLNIFAQYFKTDNFHIEWIDENNEEKSENIEYKVISNFVKDYRFVFLSAEASGKKYSGELSYAKGDNGINVRGDSDFIIYLIDKLKQRRLTEDSL